MLKNSVMSFLLNVSGTAISFFAIPITLRIMGIEYYGSFVFMQSVAMIAFTLVTVQYWQGLLVELPGKSSSVTLLKRQVGRSMLFELAGMVAATVSVLVLLLPVFHLSQVKGFGIVDVVLTVVSTLLPSLGSLVAFYRLTNKYQVLLTAGLCANILRLLLLLAAAKWSPTPSTVIVCYAVPELCRMMVLALIIHRQPADDPGAEAALVDHRAILSAGKWSTMLAVADLPVSYIDKVLVGVALSPEALGIYNILKRLYAIVSMATSPVYTNSIPEFSHKLNVGDREGAFALWRKTIMVLLPISSFIGLAAFVCRPLWVPIIYRGLDHYALELFLMMLTAVVGGSFITTHAFYWALGKRRQTSVVTVCSNLLYIGELLVLSHFFGITGAISAFLLHVSLVVVVKVTLVLKERKS
ncbi:oligosaccharide flippase family protein [Rugamonas sp. FT82W]|uniref:Oligosaccharide flippase family protein n=1 Tax=Duganella vulcania TaxID=2692166 RepID=A0A845G565_9BURK|nr:oligosaccharide flippase family protein [Duganella vulcania]MYM88087.1 oligosaccharide flippase family protein [Duganella vulcania]